MSEVKKFSNALRRIDQKFLATCKKGAPLCYYSSEEENQREELLRERQKATEDLNDWYRSHRKTISVQ